MTRKSKIYLIGNLVVPIIAGIIIVSIEYYSGFFFGDNKKIEEDIANQIQDLDKVTKSLNNLLVFVEKQKERIIRQEQAVKQLAAEKEKLEPVIKAERELIEKIFELQERRFKSRRWLDAGLGFVLGVISSMIASIILRYFPKRRVRNGITEDE